MTDLRKIAAVMGGEVRGNVAAFPTPGHGKKDRGSWASLVPGAPDGVLIYSANGGDPLAIKDELRSKGALPEREDRQPMPLLRRSSAPRPMPVQVAAAGKHTAFIYHDESGAEVFRKVRTDLENGEKTFSWHHDEGRKSGRGDQPIIPYRLDEIVREPDSIIVMAEGEKCADFLADGGFLATSSRDLPASLPWFEGRTVVILPDNDDAGQGYAKAAARKVEEASGEPFIVPLPDLEKAGDDICDWNGSPDDLVRLIERAVSGSTKTNALLPSLDLAALALTKASPVVFAIERVAPMGEVTLFTGPGGGGKSLLAHQLCTVGAAALGACLGLAVTPGPTIYVTCEDAAEHLHFRQERLCEALGVPMASLAGQLHIISLRGELDNELEGVNDKGNYSPSPTYYRLAATIRATGAKLVALDNVAHLFSGNENDRHDVTRFVNLLNRLARDTGAAILLVGHPRRIVAGRAAGRRGTLLGRGLGQAFQELLVDVVSARQFAVFGCLAGRQILIPHERPIVPAKGHGITKGRVVGLADTKHARVRIDDTAICIPLPVDPHLRPDSVQPGCRAAVGVATLVRMFAAMTVGKGVSGPTSSRGMAATLSAASRTGRRAMPQASARLASTTGGRISRPWTT